MSSKFPVVAAVLAGVLWGTVGIYIRFLSAEFSVFSQVAIRTLLAAAIILAIAIITGKVGELSVKGKDFLPFLLFGLVFNGIQFYFFNESIIRTKVGNTLFIFYTMPVFTTILAFLFLRERLDAKRIAALGLSLVGTFLLFSPGAGGNPVGNLFALLSAFFYALYAIYGRNLRRYSAMCRTFWSFLLTGALFAALTAAAGQMPARISLPSAGLFFLSSLTICATFYLFNYALQHLPASTTSILLLSEPMSAAIFAFLLLGEYLAPLAILGFLLISGAIVVDSLPGRKDRKKGGSAKNL